MASAINKLIGANVRRHASRYISTAIAVTIASTFVVLALTLVGGMSHQYTATYENSTRGTAVIVGKEYIDTEDESSEESDSSSLQNLANQASTNDESRLLDALRSVSGVKQVVPTTASVQDRGSYLLLKGSINTEVAYGDKTVLRTMSYTQQAPLATEQYASGHAPSSDKEIAIDSEAASYFNVKVGDTVSVRSAGTQDAHDLKVSGITVSSKFDTNTVFVTLQGAEAVGGYSMTDSYKLVPDDSALRSPQSSVQAQKELTANVKNALKSVNADAKKAGIEYVAYESQQFVDSGKKAQLNSATYMTSMALLFPLLAAFVASIIVGTTFRVIALQRRRELALLRAVGAQAKQVRTLLFRETSIAGMVSSLIGVTVGSLVGLVLQVQLGVAASYAESLTILPWKGILVTWIVASVLTTLIGIAPARDASKVSPLDALSPVQSVQETKRSHRVRLIIGAVILAASIAGIVYGLRMPHEEENEIYMRFGIVVLATFICWIAAMMIFSVVLPYLIHAVGALVRTPVGRLARGNVVRNPGRTASTGVAVIIGVVLMSTISVGVASVQSTLDSMLSIDYPIDITATSLKGTLTRKEIKDLSSYKHARKTALVTGAKATVNNKADDIVQVLGYSDMKDIARSSMPEIASGTVHVNPDEGYDTAKPMTLCFMPTTGDNTSASCKDYTVVKDKTVSMGSARLTAEDLKSSVPDAPTVSVIMRVEDGTKFDEIISFMNKKSSDVSVSGGYIMRAIYMQMLNVIVMVFMVLLGVSLVISLVGVANTLGLSVAERKHENGLLRALGLSRGQMRRLLVLESFLTSAVSTAVGIGLGITFGIIGMYTLPFNGLSGGVKIALPYDQLGGLFAVIVLASMLAAWLPGRQAAKVSPVEALAEE